MTSRLESMIKERSAMTEPEYWFRAKRYGWGWGLPASRHGWLFFTGWLAALALGVLLLHHALARVGYLALMTLILVAVCYVKGEPPSWRWGERD